MFFANREDERADERMAEWLAVVRDILVDIDSYRSGAEFSSSFHRQPPKRFFSDTLAIATWLASNLPSSDTQALTDIYGWVKIWFDEWSADNLPFQAVMESTYERAGITLNVGRQVIRDRCVDKSHDEGAKQPPRKAAKPRFTPPPCPHCGEKSRVTSKQGRTRHFKCTHCDATWKEIDSSV